MADKISLTIKTLDGTTPVTFPKGKAPAVIGTFTYDAKRMGSAPTITASMYYPICLDDQWTGKEYVEFNGTKYYAFRIPTSSKNNENHLYKHEIVFTDERVILESTFFFDVYVNKDSSDTEYAKRYHSNYTSFNFVGNINEFVYRLNDSLIHSGLQSATYDSSEATTKTIDGKTVLNDHYTRTGYQIVIDDGVTSDNIQVSFEDEYITDALQHIYDDYGLNYYWIGTVCHVGDCYHAIQDELAYQKGLLSVTIGDTNNKIFDRITGVGSSDNLPYYYPNDNAEGSANYTTSNIDKNLVQIDLAKVMSYDVDCWTGKHTFTFCKQNNYPSTSYDFIKEMGSWGKTAIVDKNVRTDNSTYTVLGKDAIFIGNANDYTLDYQDRHIVCRVWIPKGGYIDFSNLVCVFNIKFHLNYINTEGTQIDGTILYGKDATTGEYVITEASFEEKEYIKQRIAEQVIIIDNSSCQYIQTVDESTGEATTTPTKFQASHDGWYRVETVQILKYEYKESYVKTWQKFKAYNISNSEVSANTKSNPSTYTIRYTPTRYAFFKYNGDNEVEYASSGITFTGDVGSVPAITYDYTTQDTYPTDGSYPTHSVIEEENPNDNAAKITFSGREYITPCTNLMPSIYIDSEGYDRFYDAKNHEDDNSYVQKLGNDVEKDYWQFYDTAGATSKASASFYDFINIYQAGNPHEGKQDFDDIKPSIVGVLNSKNELFGEIADVKFDVEDSDEFKSDSSSEYLHSFFYIKLHIFDTDAHGFNLFMQALEDEKAYINMTSGDCSACAFEIQVKECPANSNKFYNPVITDNDGNLVAIDSDTTDSGWQGTYITRYGSDSSEATTGSYVEPYDNSYFITRQQNTFTNEVWIAVKKDCDTFGVLMPQKTQSETNAYVPKAGDTFVITGIKMPNALIRAAEEKLSKALIKYMREQNEVVNNISVTFSRNYLRAHANDDVAIDGTGGFLKLKNALNENACLTIKYDSQTFANLFVSNYTCKADANFLYEITIELVAKLSTSTSQSESQADALKQDILDSVGGGTSANIDAIYAVLQNYFLSKNKEDIANYHITFNKGLTSEDAVIHNDTTTLNGTTTINGTTQVNEKVNIGTPTATITGVGTSTGIELSPDGSARFSNIEVGGSLTVPQFIYNRAEVMQGVKILSPAAGVIETVVPDQKTNGSGVLLYQAVNNAGVPLYYLEGTTETTTTNTGTPVETTTETDYPIYGTTGTAYLKLEQGEVGSLEQGDMLLGFWHFDDYTKNLDEDTDDHIGNFSMSGFATCYFKVEKVDTENCWNGGKFTYSLRPTDDSFTQKGIHPCANMTFMGFGNDGTGEHAADRQSIYVVTKDYRVQIVGKSGWNYKPYIETVVDKETGDITYKPHNYFVDILGKLDGFTMVAKNSSGNYYIKEFSGYGHVTGDLQIWGTLTQFEVDKFVASQKLHYFYSDSEEKPAIGDKGWSDDISTLTTKKYLYEYWSYTYTDGSSDNSAVFLAGSQGSDGKSGGNAVIYTLVPEQTGVELKNDGTYSEERLSVLIQKNDGGTIYPSVTYGKILFIIDETADTLTGDDGSVLDFGDDDESNDLEWIEYPDGGIELGTGEGQYAPKNNVKFVLINENNSCIDTKTIPVNADGASIRPCGRWVEGNEYVHNSQWIDVVTYQENEDEDEDFYEVKSGVFSTTAIPTDTNYWEKANKLGFVATSLLMSDAIYTQIITAVAARIGTLYVEKFQAMNGDNKIATINEFGAGAYIQYYEDGVTPKMKISDGVISYYNEDGTLKWSLGGSGTIEQKVTYFEVVYLYKCINEDFSDIKTTDSLAGTKCKIYHTSSGVNNGKYLVGDWDESKEVTSEAFIEEGWWTAAGEPKVRPATKDATLYSYERIVYYIKDGSITATDTIGPFR